MFMEEIQMLFDFNFLVNSLFMCQSHLECWWSFCQRERENSKWLVLALAGIQLFLLFRTRISHIALIKPQGGRKCNPVVYLK